MEKNEMIDIGKYRLASMKSVADLLSISVNTVQYWIRKKDLHFYESNGNNKCKIVLIDWIELKQWLKANNKDELYDLLQQCDLDEWANINCMREEFPGQKEERIRKYKATHPDMDMNLYEKNKA